MKFNLQATMGRLAAKRLVILYSAAVLGMFLLGLAYAARGFYFLTGEAKDFNQRWVEQQYIFRGKNPLAVHLQADQANSTGRPIQGDNKEDPDLGVPVAHLYYAIINMLLLLLILFWANICSAPGNAQLGLFLTASCFAVSSICTTLGVGQYGVVILASLVAALECGQRNGRKYQIAAGLALGASLLKFPLSGPFFLVFLLHRRWVALTVAFAYTLAATAIVSWRVKTDPLTMLREMFTIGAGFADMGYSPISYAIHAGFPAGLVIKFFAAGTMLLAGWLLYCWRHAPVLTQFAIAAVAARFWSYHCVYDNLVVVFLLLALGRSAWERKSKILWAAFVLAGLSLWAPAGCTDHEVFQLYQMLAWPACLAALLHEERDSTGILRPVGNTTRQPELR